MSKNKPYIEKLKDPRWQKKRLDVLERDNWTCQLCGNKEKTLHVHHTTYFPNCEPWGYPDILLITLCEKCHKHEHDKKEGAICIINDSIEELKESGFLYSDIALILDLAERHIRTRKQLIDISEKELSKIDKILNTKQ